MINLKSIPLAALLHDIGKLKQLAGNEISDYETGLMKKFDLKEGEKSSHFHAIRSAAFLKEHLKNGKDEIIQLVLYHHFPEKVPDYKIKIDVMRLALADWLANGKYRGHEQKLEDEAFTRPLISIFSQISKEKHTSQQRYIKPCALDLNLSNLFPRPISEFNSDNVKNDFNALWDGFTNEFKKVDLSSEFEKYFSTLLDLFEKYTITIPALSEEKEQFISLYHHLKTTAAIATCLVSLKDEKIEKAYDAIKANKSNSSMMNEPSFYLVGGDISGIQDFIYSVTSENALRGLRGRSFYLQLISEAVAKSILDKFNLTPANILFIGGGHFFLLLPKTEHLEDELEKMTAIIDHNLLEAHRGKLAFAIAQQSLSFDDFLGAGFGQAFDLLKKKLSIAKRRKFSSLMKTKTDLNKIIKLPDIGGTQEVCEICSDELTDHEQKIAKQTKIHQCSFCKSYINLAYNLAHNDFLIERKLPGNFKKFDGEFGSYEDVLRYLGYQFKFDIDKKVGETNLLINSTDFLNDSKSYNGFRFFPKHAPIQRGKKHVKTLEELSKDAIGLRRWGVFRADVDELGKIFKEGLGESQTITSISMLSYFVSLFFSAQVEWIAKNEFEGKIYIIYSGGDDMFALGSWSALPDFAARIQDSFIKFTGDNPAIRISGGIYISPSDKFPVYQAASSAGDSLKLAKNDGRNRTTIFENSMLWNEFASVKNLAYQVANLLVDKGGNKKVPQSLLRILNSGWAEK